VARRINGRSMRSYDLRRTMINAVDPKGKDKKKPGRKKLIKEKEKT